MQLYWQLVANRRPVKIYVPGDRHTSGRIEDSISLADAGKKYLMGCGVPESDIFAQEMNDRFKGNSGGVYSSADECYVAAQIFEEERFGELWCVCSPGQMIRKVLFYLEFGVLPLCHTVPVANMHHNYMTEIFDSIPNVVLKDHSLQGNSETANQLRADRVPLT
jgi:hypothetical protein